MGTKTGESDFKSDVIGNSELDKDAAQERTRAVTSPHPKAQLGDDEPAPGGPVEGAPEMPDGQMAHFRFVDGVTLEIHIPHAIGVGGGGVAEYAVPWFVFRGADRSVMNEGPLVGVA